jgi:hypothetical protein
VISEIRSRGPGGAGDEFIELWNPTSTDVVLDDTWKLDARKPGSNVYTTRWTGTGKTIPAHGHFLIGGTSYSGTPAYDEKFSSGVTDTTNVRLLSGTTTIDAVCFYSTAAAATDFDATFTCEGTPVSNAPHSDASGAASDVDASIERAPGGSGDNCTDTDDNAADFIAQSPSTPQSSTSAPTP